ncbi:lysine--tRNA ligase [Patescibacteria group bacterium]|nr:MAG: lysine--tRNA ligase [Patescibacteria group bacterium]
MFWLDTVFESAETRLKKTSELKGTLLVRDEKTASGRVHVGSMRALALHAAISERLNEAGIKNIFKYEINDFDPMDGLPVYLDASVYKEHMGKPLLNIPSPDESVAPNFAEYFAKEYIDAIHEAGFNPEFYRASELYLSGKMNGVIRTALERADKVRAVYKKVSGADRPSDWLPLSVICEKCGKVGTTKAKDFDGETVAYTCYPTAVKWAEGCGHSGRISPFDGNAKLPWKVEWAAKWMVMQVDVEGGGKDHYSKGGAREVARYISEEVFEYPEPFGVPNEFFLVGGKKMSSSKGEGSSAKEIVDLLPPSIFRLALFGKDMNQQINFDPAGDTIPVLFDTYDKLAEKYWSGIVDDDSRLFEYIHTESERVDLKGTKRFLPRFSQVAFLVQMPHLDNEEELLRLKGSLVTKLDTEEFELRAKYAQIWLERTASPEFRFALQTKSVPEGAKKLSDAQKSALREILSFVESHDVLSGLEFHTELHEIRKRQSIEPKALFGAIYLSFLGKDHGPKAGWFLSVLERDFVIRRLKEVAGVV